MMTNAMSYIYMTNLSLSYNYEGTKGQATWPHLSQWRSYRARDP